MMPRDQREFPYKSGNPWLSVDRRDDYEEFIAGNRSGLEALKTAVDKALIDGKAEIDIPFTDYPGIVLVEGDPRETNQQKPRFRDWIAGATSLLLMAILILGSFAVVIFLVKWLLRFTTGK
jgi:hypothetical protein